MLFTKIKSNKKAVKVYLLACLLKICLFNFEKVVSNTYVYIRIK